MAISRRRRRGWPVGGVEAPRRGRASCCAMGQIVGCLDEGLAHQTPGPSVPPWTGLSGRHWGRRVGVGVPTGTGPDDVIEAMAFLLSPMARPSIVKAIVSEALGVAGQANGLRFGSLARRAYAS